jgi:hypothetical protein
VTKAELLAKIDAWIEGDEGKNLKLTRTWAYDGASDTWAYRIELSETKVAAVCYSDCKTKVGLP